MKLVGAFVHASRTQSWLSIVVILTAGRLIDSQVEYQITLKKSSISCKTWVENEIADHRTRIDRFPYKGCNDRLSKSVNNG